MRATKKNSKYSMPKTAALIALSLLAAGCRKQSASTSAASGSSGGASLSGNSSGSTTGNTTGGVGLSLSTALKYQFYITGNNLLSPTLPEHIVAGCFGDLSTCFTNVSPSTYGVKNSVSSVTSIPATTDSRLVIRASANVSSGVTVAGQNAAYVANHCLQYTISVNGYTVPTRLLTNQTGATTCNTLDSSGLPITLPAQAYDDIDFTNCMGNIGTGPISIQVKEAQYEFRCTNQNISTGCPTGPVYQNHIVSGSLWVETDSSQLPTVTGSTIVARACDGI